MPRYHYRALSTDGKEIQGDRNAITVNDLLVELEQEGWTPIEILDEKSKSNFLTQDIQIFKKKFSADQCSLFCGTLASFYRSNLTVNQIFELMPLSTGDKMVSEFCKTAQRKLSEGQSLTKIFADSADLFPTAIQSFIEIGETANSMAPTMEHAQNYFQRYGEARNKLISAFAYPCVLLLASLLLISLLIFYLVPTLTPIFEASNITLPLLFSVLSSFKLFLVEYYWLYLPLLFFGVCLIIVLLSLKEYKSLIRQFIYRTPILGKILLNNQFALDVRFLGLMIDSGYSITQAFERLSESHNDIELARMYLTLVRQMKEGVTLSDTLAEFKWLPTEFKTFMKIAEATNEWQSSTQSLADILETKSTRDQERLMQILTPAITIFVGLVIGLFVYVVVDAILQINDIALG